MGMKAIDLYNTFDINVKKKWQKNHLNSWNLIIKGNDPKTKRRTTLEFTLQVMRMKQNEVGLTGVKSNNLVLHPEMIFEKMRQFDDAIKKR